jgi:hypothetical protein
MPDGKRAPAPCGHDGEHVVGNYIRCLQGCDRVKPAVINLSQCPSCGSSEIEPFDLDPLFYIYNPDTPIVDTHCIKCGNCW